MNSNLEELKKRAQLLTSREELELYAPYPKYMSLLEAAVKEQYELSPVKGGFMFRHNEVPVIVKPLGADPAARLEGLADIQR